MFVIDQPKQAYTFLVAEQQAGALPTTSGEGRVLIIDQLVRSLVVEPTHPGSSPRLGTGARIFLNFLQDFLALCFKW